MTDVFTKQKRSEIMARVKSEGNKATELRLKQLFRHHHITGWRRKYVLFGKPDFVFPKFRLAIFVDGCFWHGCPLHASQPASNIIFWREKLYRNKERDKLVNRTLRSKDWRVLRIWQHELKEPDKVYRRISSALKKAKQKRGVHPAIHWADYS